MRNIGRKMDRLLDLVLTGGLRPPLFHPDVLALDRQLPRSEMLALLLLQRHGERTMSELAEHLGAPLSTASGIGERLARRGLVRRHRRPEDRRVVAVRLTKKGEAAAGKLREQFDGLLRRVTGALTEEELAQFLAIIAKVWAAFQVPSKETSLDTIFRSIPIDE
jgi:DNA-binding MarR family transcriptional regulator